MLAIIIVLSALNLGSLEIYNDFAPMGWCVVVFVIDTFTTTAFLFYLSIVLAMLLLQIGAPMVPERWKQTLKPKIHIIVEGIIHLIIQILSLSYATGAVFFDNPLTLCRDHKCIEPKAQLGWNVFSYASLVLPLILLIIAILFLCYFCIKFRRNKTVTRRTKWPLFKLSMLILLLITELAVTAFHLKYLNLTTLIIGEVFFSLIRMAGLLALLALVYLPSIQCRERCKCFKRACNQAPLLSLQKILL